MYEHTVIDKLLYDRMFRLTGQNYQRFSSMPAETTSERTERTLNEVTVRFLQNKTQTQRAENGTSTVTSWKQSFFGPPKIHTSPRPRTSFLQKSQTVT